MQENSQAGWFYCQGDPPNTLRYWDGFQWVGAPQYPAQASPTPPSATPAPTHLPGIGTFADPWLRFSARLIDMVILFCVVYGTNSLIGMFAADRALDGITTRGMGGIVDAFNAFGLIALITALVSLVFSAAYEVGFTMYFGATPGKLALGFRLVDQAGKTPLGWQPAIVRWIPFGVLLLIARMPFVSIIGALGLLALSILGLVLILVSATRQAPWDVLAKTYVVTKNTQESASSNLS